jgi:hypothetical protein
MSSLRKASTGKNGINRYNKNLDLVPKNCIPDPSELNKNKIEATTWMR